MMSEVVGVQEVLIGLSVFLFVWCALLTILLRRMKKDLNNWRRIYRQAVMTGRDSDVVDRQTIDGWKKTMASLEPESTRWRAYRQRLEDVGAL